MLPTERNSGKLYETTASKLAKNLASILALLSPNLVIELTEALNPYEKSSVPYLVKLTVLIGVFGMFQFSSKLKYSLNNPPVALSEEFVPTG